MGRRLAFGCLLAVALGYTASAHIRILHPSNGSPLYWANPASVGVTINSAGSDDILDGSHETAVRNAIDAWNVVPGSGANLIENTNPGSKARTDWAADDIHLVWFDEAGSSGYFPGSSGVVAITPLWFVSDGRITDADILFNGKTFQFTTSGEPGRFDVQDVVTHELGHFLGLDHSGHAGAAMFPYVDPTVILHRSLSLDDAYGVRSAYPAATFGSFSGRVLHYDDSPVARPHVIAVDADGRTAAAALGALNGTFLLRGLDAGTYSIYVDPLDDPVSAANLTGSYTVDLDFESTWYTGQHTVAVGQTVALGDLSCGPDVSIQIGRSSDRLPRRATAGVTTLHSLRGTGLVNGSTLTASDPDVVLTPVSWLGTVVTFQVTVPTGEASGHVDVIVTSPFGAVDVLPGGLEITPSDPIVSSVTPSQGSLGGGNTITIAGAEFHPGARVVIGDRIYVDGLPGGCTVVDENTITLTTSATVGGLHDVVVIDASGVEGRLASAFQTTELPQVDVVFPPSGDVDGGTELILTGADFVSGAQVTVGGASATVTFVDASRLEVVTPAGGGAGTVSLQITNPGGYAASSTFTYVAKDDPQLGAVAPGSGASSGGELVTIIGDNFGPDSRVWFGVDPETGAGGSEAGGVVVVDANTITAVTPGGGGTVAVLVCDETTGQASLLPSAFTYVSSESSGGGGCGMIATPGPGPWRQALAGSLWIALLLGFGLVRLASARRVLAG
ncbi:IPT/TIG domain-containing protein [Engelhardtia mirabilis]|uniref:IPT/TIG domain protein n=1 Tax=Engelhardtia mirabilis TaxID=2528011 RepID=A0A518BP13_9BACT|nr:IPT/TIG domain protein [Planctomycetes bacterium Pla133]QDV03000.1 IPT/TIG domain protein [Planctomycetes bacterium Pla86]